MSVDNSKIKFDQILPDLLKSVGTIGTEQDCRLRLIDRILIDVLGWRTEEIFTEKKANEAGYTDYLLRHGERNLLVIEAKNKLYPIVNTKSDKRAAYLLSGPVFEEARKGIAQGIRYASQEGVTAVSLSNGVCWAAFRQRTDGINVMQGKAIVFPTLESISCNFTEFYELFSRDGITNRLNLIRFNQAEGLNILPEEKLIPITSKEWIKLQKKSDMAVDLEKIFSKFFSTMSGDDDPELLAHCFVETVASQDADRTLQKITSDLVNYVKNLNSGTGQQLVDEINQAIETQQGEFALIVGNKGAGKTTFIDRFFKQVLNRNIKERCLVLRIDLADSDGDLTKCSQWVHNKLIEAVDNKLYSGISPDFDELVGIYFSDYQRWSKGEYKHLYEKDKEEFKIEFGKYIFGKRNQDRVSYLKKLLQHAIQARGLMPCLVFDNADHFPQSYQEAVFQVAQSLHRSCLSFVIFPVTDKTIWQLSKSGPFQSYPTKHFYLPVPSAKQILEKRVSFLKEKASQEASKAVSYFTAKGIRLKIDNISAFAACVEGVFLNTDFVSKRVSWLANHDIRRSLNISQQILISPHIEIEDIFSSYFSKKDFSVVPFYKIMDALICGNYNRFNQEHNSTILNLYSISPKNISTPLLKLRIMRLLMDIEGEPEDIISSHISVEDIEKYFEPLGIDLFSLENALSELLKYRLVESFDPSDDTIRPYLRLAITYAGKMHYELALHDKSYASQMAITTNVRNEFLAKELRFLSSKKMNPNDYWNQVRTMFYTYCIEQDRIFITLPENDSYATQRTLPVELKSQWIKTSGSALACP